MGAMLLFTELRICILKTYYYVIREFSRVQSSCVMALVAILDTFILVHYRVFWKYSRQNCIIMQQLSAKVVLNGVNMKCYVSNISLEISVT